LAVLQAVQEDEAEEEVVEAEEEGGTQEEIGMLR
jgi:hypothetical protein